MGEKRVGIGWPHKCTPVDGRPIWENLIVCLDCGAKASSRIKAMKVSGNRAFAAVESFKKLGWTKINVGTGICPACSNKAKLRVVPKEPIEETMSTDKNTSANVTQPRSMSALQALPDMYLMLGEYYDREAKNYRGDWSDAKIAEKLKLSPEFVANRREQDFGPLAPRVEPLAKVVTGLELVKSARTACANANVTTMRSAFEVLNAALADLDQLVAVSEVAHWFAGTEHSPEPVSFAEFSRWTRCMAQAVKSLSYLHENQEWIRAEHARRRGQSPR